MARARNIKPGFFKNEDLAECSPFARLCFAGLWTMADREGRLEDRPKRIKGELFPYDSVEVAPLLEELATWGFIRRYQVGDGRFIFIVKFVEHQTPHGTEKDGSIPDENGFLTLHERAKNGYITGNFRLEPYALTVKGVGQSVALAPPGDSGLTVNEPCQEGGQNTLIPDSGFLIPDSPSLIPDSGFLIPDSGLFAEAPSAPPPAAAPAPKPRKAAAPKAELPTVGTWKAYASSYEVRYRVAPVRNGTVNGQLANLVARLGAEEAPAVAAFYVRSNNSRYVGAGHSVGMLLMDAEKLRTEWATGRQTTATQARLVDQTQTNANAFAGLLSEAQQRETHGQP